MAGRQTNKIIRYLKKWDELLSHDGLNTKMMVRNDLKYLLVDFDNFYKEVKWQDLHFTPEKKSEKVLLNGNTYLIEYAIEGNENVLYIISDNKYIFKKFTNNKYDIEFFNNLNLEVLNDVDCKR